MTNKKNNGTNGAAGKAGGIFGKSAGKMFRVTKYKDGRVNYLDPTKIDKPTRERWRTDRPSRVPPDGEPVNSRKLDPNDPNLKKEDREMMDAVEDARRQLGNDGGRNFAALRYIDSDGQERILVTRSDGVHSERMGANFLLDQGIDPKNIKAVYTERSPCDYSASYCDQWMKMHIPGADVSHRFDYGINGTTRSQANGFHRTYRNGLF
ncbi:nucleic acid/nucleotide deaminase domain-containing protein [Spirillospora sp. NPDC052242]